MDELKKDIRCLIIDYNININNNPITCISFTDKVDVYGDINTNNIIASYTISYQDGSCQTWSNYDNMKFYLKGMIDGFSLLKQQKENI